MRAISPKEEIKGIQIIFAEDMILYVENSNHATKNLLGLINKFSKVAEHKIDF